GAEPRSRGGQRRGAPGQRGMVRDSEIESEQADAGADQPFGLPQSQAEHGAQRQRRRDRQGRIVGLTAPRGPWLCAPGRDRLFGEPHRQAATLAQGSIIFRPVRYPILLLRNAVTAIGIGLEWHGGHLRGCGWGVAPSHLGLLSQICRPYRLGGERNLDQRPAKSRSPNGEWSSTLPSPRRSAQLIRAT